MAVMWRERTWLPVSISFNIVPFCTFQNLIVLSAVPPPVARIPDICGSHASAFTAAVCSWNLYNGWSPVSSSATLPDAGSASVNGPVATSKELEKLVALALAEILPPPLPLPLPPDPKGVERGNPACRFEPRKSHIQTLLSFPPLARNEFCGPAPWLHFRPQTSCLWPAAFRNGRTVFSRTSRWCTKRSREPEVNTCAFHARAPIRC